MKYLFKQVNPIWWLRLGLGGVYFFTSINLIMYPTGWHWAIRPLPQFVQAIINNIGIDTYLRIQGIGEFAIALALFAWFLSPRIVAIASFLIALQMALILLFIGLTLETFRDIGIFGAALALSLMVNKQDKYGIK